jgi:hypothetical protein
MDDKMLSVKMHKSCRESLSVKDFETFKMAVKWALDYYGLSDKRHRLDFYFFDDLESSVEDKDKITVGRFKLNTRGHSEILLKKNRPLSSLIKTAFHEITHLKHHLDFDVCYTQYGKTWRGTMYPVVDRNNFEQYWNLPDEIDARVSENKMFIRWTFNRIIKQIMFWRKF